MLKISCLGGVVMEVIKCPGCNANLLYDINDEILQCEYCGNICNINKVKMDEAVAEYETIEMNEYVCPNCSAKLFVNGNTMSTKCVYCNTSLLDFYKVKVYRPDKILLFKLDKDNAKSIAIKRLEKLNIEYKKELVDRLEPIYFPFWLYDCELNDPNILKGKTIHFSDVLVDGSFKLNDDIANIAEYDFDLSDFTQFEPEMIVGYVAEKYDYSDFDEIIFDRAINKMQHELYRYYNVYAKEELYEQKSGLLLLLPFYYSKVDDEQLLVNAQTGRISCNGVVDKNKVETVNLNKKWLLIYLSLFLGMPVLGAIRGELFFLCFFGLMLMLPLRFIVLNRKHYRVKIKESKELRLKNKSPIRTFCCISFFLLFILPNLAFLVILLKFLYN